MFFSFQNKKPHPQPLTLYIHSKKIPKNDENAENKVEPRATVE